MAEKAISARDKYPKLYIRDWIDRRGRSRQVPMQVLSLGFSRTGTKSMQQALEILYGEPCYHWDSVAENIPDCDLWCEALDAKYSGKGTPYTRKEWDALLGDFAAVTDMPANVFGPELIEAYPEAKVVLVEREVESWEKSWESMFLTPNNNRLVPLLVALDPSGLGRMLAVVKDRICPGAYGSCDPKELNANARTYYREHYATIRAATPPDRLLEYELGSGWEPLCDFLGVKVPDVPFPHVNERADQEERIGAFMYAGIQEKLSYVADVMFPWRWRWPGIDRFLRSSTT